jgi:hypothetical protein
MSTPEERVGAAIASAVAAAIPAARSDSPYGSPDTFGSNPFVVRMLDPSTGLVWSLGFGPPVSVANGGDGVTPTVIYVSASTWAVAKSRLGISWQQVKLAASTWQLAKAFTLN